MLWKLTQRTFNGGQLDARLMGRADLEKYYGGASELKNFIVKRQGCITRRRGTDSLAVVTTAATAAGIASVAKWRMIPFTYETTGGYALILVAGASGTGKCLVYGKTGVLKATLDVPYTGAEFATICHEQSGDTLFLAHRSHPFARMVRNGDTNWTYSEVDFYSCGRESLPAIPVINTSQSGKNQSDPSWSGSGPQKTIEYCATAVKDGIESPASEAFKVTYNTPWPEGGTVLIKINSMDPSPDYCNIYKKDGNLTGFVGVAEMTKTAERRTKPKDYLGGVTNKNKFQWYPATDDLWDEVGQLNNEVPYASGSSAKMRAFLCKTGTVEYKVYVGYDQRPVEADCVYLALGGVVQSYKDDESNDTFLEYVPCNCNYIEAVLTLEDNSTLTLDRKEVPAAAKVPSGAAASTYRREVPGGDDYTNRRKAAVRELWRGGPDEGVADGHMLRWDFDSDTRSGRRIKKITFKAYENSSGGDPLTGSMTLGSSGSPWISITGTPLVMNGVWLRKIVYSSTMQFIDDYITPDASLTPPKYEGHFDETGKYPGCVTLYQQRLALGSTDKQPFTFWLSCVGDLYNFNAHDSVRDDDAMEVTLPATKYPDINHLLLNRDLLLLCDSGEWVVAPVSGNSVTHKTISTKIQSQMGCSALLKPVAINDEVLFANATGETLFATKYSYSTDGYDSIDLSVLSQDLFDGNPMTSFAFCQHPDSTIYATLADGSFATLTYMKEHEVVAWARHELGGGLKALCCCADGAATNGTTDVYILAQGMDGSLRLLKVKGEAPAGTVEEAVSMDMMYAATTGGTVPSSRKAVDVLTGAVLSAGETMTSGRRYIVGYPFASRLVTVKPEPGAKETVRFEIKNPTEAEICVLDGSTFRIGQYGVDAAQDRTIALEPTASSGAVSLATADKATTITGMNKRDGRMRLTCDGVWPLTVLSLSTTYLIEQANQEPRGSRQEGVE